MASPVSVVARAKALSTSVSSDSSSAHKPGNNSIPSSATGTAAVASSSVNDGSLESPTRKKKRPPKLDLEDTGSASSGPNTASFGALRTPKELANDIAIQCVSPGIPSFMTSDAILMAKAVEQRQRKIIADRERIAAITPARTPGRRSRPGNIEIYPAHKVTKPRINSAPLHHPYFTPLTSNSSNFGLRRNSPPISVVSRSSLGARGDLLMREARSALPNGNGSGPLLAPQAPHTAKLPPQNSNWGDLPTSHSRSKSLEDNIAEEEAEEQEEYGDPEDAALSESEVEEPSSSSKSSILTSVVQTAGQLRGKKERFLELCGDMFDLLHEENDAVR